MADNRDKTVFRPGGSSRGDSTVIRPTPGRRTGQTQVPPPPQQQPNYGGGQPDPYQSGYGQQPQQPPQSNYANAPHPGGMPPMSGMNQFATIYGLNPLVNAASTLIAVYLQTRQSMSHPNIAGLHQQLVTEIRAFENKARDSGAKPEIVLAARYVLCTVLDEGIMHTPWGAESAWASRTLLSIYHNEAHGGEKFFLILDRMRNSPAENLDILELMYICLSLGYEGKYKLVNRGRDMLEQIRDEIFRVIRNHRGEYERSLSPSWHGLGKIRNTLAEYVPMWVVASIVGGIMLLSYSGFRYWLYHSTSHVANQLSVISQDQVGAAKNKLRTGGGQDNN